MKNPIWISVAALVCCLVVWGCDRAASSPTTEKAVGEKPEPADPIAAADADYAAILAEVVNEEGLVRYDRLASEPHVSRLDSVTARYAAATLPADPKQRLAYQCNVFNSNVLAMALRERRKPDFTSVEHVPGFFDQMQITVGGASTTLNALKDEIRAHGDPRIHAALVLAARSSPPLRNQPYSGSDLDRQLADQSLQWIEDRTKNRAEPSGLKLSKVFEWHEADFAIEPYRGPIGFIKAFGRTRGQMRDYLNNMRDPKITYIPYDWRLNQAPIEPADHG